MNDNQLKIDINEYINALNKGEIIIFPTETVYGVGVDGTNINAIDGLFELKNRSKYKPITLHISNIEMIKERAIINEYAKKLIADFWPGPLTIILNVKRGKVPPNINNNGNTIGFRMPDDNITREIIEMFGKPIAGTSANVSGCLSSNSFNKINKNFKSKVKYAIDSGTTKIGIESTVIDLTKKNPVIIRLGHVTKYEIECSLSTNIDIKESR